MKLPIAHEAFLKEFEQKTKSDSRFLGVTVGGSFATGNFDEFSDLDFIIVVEEKSYERMLRERQAFAVGMGELLAAFTGEHVGEPRLLICLYGNPTLHVDLKFMTLKAFGNELYDVPKVLWEKECLLSNAIKTAQTTQRPLDPQWLEDRFWTWIHYAACKIGRGEYFEALETLSFLRERALSPLAMHIKGLTPRGVRRIESICAEDLELFKKTIAPNSTSEALIKSFEATVELYCELRSRLKNPLLNHKGAEIAAREFLQNVKGQ